MTDRERRIFEARHLADEAQTLEDLAVKFKVRERVRQIEARRSRGSKTAKNLALAPAAMQLA
jgi:RNA polymerase sigma-32 factor